MATKRTSRKAETTAPAQSPIPRMRPPSPLSPTRQSRVDEKRQMQDLNDRLASYIEAVRSRDVQIRNMREERTVIEETHTVEIKQMKNMYSNEIGQLRAAVDAISKEKAKVEIEADRAVTDAREVKAELMAKEKRLAVAERELQTKTQRLSDLEAKVSNMDAELKNLRPENAKLMKKLEDTRSNLEDEILKRSDFENQLLSLQEELKFDKSMYEQQLNESKVRKQMELSEIDGRLNEEYEKKLKEALNELRDTCERQARENREEFSKVYEDKLVALQGRLDEERMNCAGVSQELRERDSKMSFLTARNSELEASASNLQNRLANLLRQMEDKEVEFRTKMARKDAEVQNKEEQMAEMLKDYKDLMEIKIGLDMEIAAYRKMLEGEEARLGLGTPDQGDDALATPARGTKRRRMYFEEEETFHMVSDHTGTGKVNILPVEKDGKWIAIQNKTDEEILIGGWTLVNTSDDKVATYKFPRSAVLPAATTCKVWSSDAKEEPSPPTTLVMKKGGWIIGSRNKTVLTNKDGGEEACSIAREERRQLGRYRSGTLSADEENKCAIM